MEKAALVSCVNVNLQAQSQIDKDKDKTRTDRVEFGDETGDAGVGLRGGLFGKGSKSVTLASGRGSVFVGSSDGTVAIANHTLSVVFAWRAHEASLSLLRCLSASNTLVSVGEDAAGIPFLRIWNLDKIDKATRCPLIMRSITIQHNNRVTALAILETLSQIAIGLENGVVLLIRGDIANPERLVKPKQIWEGSQVITGEKTLTSWFKNYLVIVSRPQSTAGSNQRAKPQVSSLLAKVNALNLEKAELSADEDDDRPVLGTVLTVYDLRSKCIAFQGSFELSNGGKAGSASRSGIVSMACEWDELFVVTADQKMYKLEERDMSTRLDILFQKNMYTLALAMVSAPPNSVLPIPSLTARTQSSKNLHDLTSSFMAMESSPALLSYITDPETRSLLIEIHKRYADHLYSKGDFEAAMTQYLHTLGHLEPSYVIRKYLDAQRIHLLVQFLQALHMYSGSVHGPSSNAASGRRLATPDHTTLLINCYTKLQAADRLDEFLRRADVQFDVDNAIRVCRAAGFYEHALYLSERFGVHEWYLHIQVEDLGRHAETVEYIMGLSPAVMESCLRRYGHVLVKEMVKEMIDVLVVLCTTKRAVDDESSGKGAGMIGSPIPGGEDEDSLTLSMMGAPPSGGMIMMDRKRVSSGTVTAATVAQETTIPFPEDFIHLFVDMDAWCVMFLERVLEIRWGISLAVGGFGDASQAGQMAALEEREEKSLTVVCNTLLEMCLNLSSASAVSQSESDLSLAESRRAKAMHLLQHSKTRYDLDHALILCQINKFQAGIMYLYERMQMYNEILEHYMTNDDYSSVIEFCIKFG
ncbi:Vacuolar protein sorting-associated protein 11, partial [Chytriomyces hyalinus]